jgi:hypothetical protein
MAITARTSPKVPHEGVPAGCPERRPTAAGRMAILRRFRSGQASGQGGQLAPGCRSRATRTTAGTVPRSPQNDAMRRASGGGASPAGNASTSSRAYRTLLPLRPPKNRRKCAVTGRSRCAGCCCKIRNDASSPWLAMTSSTASTPRQRMSSSSRSAWQTWKPSSASEAEPIPARASARAMPGDSLSSHRPSNRWPAPPGP